MGRMYCVSNINPPDPPDPTAEDLRANLAPETELDMLWGILGDEGLHDKIESLLLQRLVLEHYGP